MQTKIYKANVNTPLGKFLIAVAVEHKDDVSTDVRSAAAAEFRCAYGLVQVNNITKSNRRATNNMWPIKQCTSKDGHWAWIAKQ